VNGPIHRPPWAPENWFANAKLEHNKTDYRYDENGAVECIDTGCGCLCAACVMEKKPGLFQGQPVGTSKEWSSTNLEERGYVGLYKGHPPSRDAVLEMEREAMGNLLRKLEEDLQAVGGPVVHPEHYNACGEKGEDGSVEFEPIKVIEAWGWGEGFCYGNAIKYILRAPHKGSERADLEKAHWYLCRLFEQSPGPRTVELPDPVDVAEAWSLPPDLKEAIEFIATGSYGAAARKLTEHLAAMSMAKNTAENVDDELEREFEEAGRLTDSAVADAHEDD